MKRASFLSKAYVGAFALSLVVTVMMPWCTADGVHEAHVFVAAFTTAVPDIDEIRPGDVVLVHPPWRDDVVAALRAEHSLGKRIVPKVALAKRHGEKTRRVWLVQDLGAPGLSDAMTKRVQASPSKNSQEHKGIRVMLVDDTKSRKESMDVNPSEKRFVAYLPAAEVSVEKADGSVARCAYDDEKMRHLCSGLNNWMWVGEKKQPVNGRSESCIWSHPISGGKVRIRFPGLSFSADDVKKGLLFEHALADAAAADATGKNVVASVVVDGKVRKRFTRTNRRGFSKGRVPLTGVDEKKPHNVEVQIETIRDGARHYCWRLRKGG
ncbi:MAG: hypothetical protein GY822_05060 [Deltaproteobacteria bacterium]|nr:hypothetical protein [Deltaproteobacteria bacterium]